jgi:hypothetical protein
MARVQSKRKLIRSQRANLRQFAQKPFIERVHVLTDCLLRTDGGARTERSDRPEPGLAPVSRCFRAIPMGNRLVLNNWPWLPGPGAVTDQAPMAL